MTEPETEYVQVERTSRAPSQQELKRAIQRFSDLYDHVYGLMFSKNLFHELFFKLESRESSPYLSSAALIDRILILLLGAFSSTALLGISAIIFGILPAATSNSSIGDRAWVDYLFYLIAIYAWVRWLIFLFFERVASRRARLILFVATFLISFVVFPITVEALGDPDVLPDSSLANNLYGWLLAIALIIFPLFSFSIILWLLILSPIMHIIQMIIRFHNPITDTYITRLLTEPIPRKGDRTNASGEASEGWWLTKLDEREKDLLFEWAERNLHNVEKRVLPTAIIFAVVGVFVEAISSTRTFQEAFDNSLQWLISTQTVLPPVEAFTGDIVLILVVGLVLAFIVMISLLFERIAVLGLILELEPWMSYLRPPETANTREKSAGESRSFLSRLFSTRRG